MCAWSRVCNLMMLWNPAVRFVVVMVCVGTDADGTTSGSRGRFAFGVNPEGCGPGAGDVAGTIDPAGVPAAAANAAQSPCCCIAMSCCWFAMAANTNLR